MEPIVEATAEEFEGLEVKAVKLGKDHEEKTSKTEEQDQVYDNSRFFDDDYSDEEKDDLVERVRPLCDMDHHEKQFVAAKGGEPGLGNKIIASRAKRHMLEMVGSSSSQHGPPSSPTLERIAHFIY